MTAPSPRLDCSSAWAPRKRSPIEPAGSRQKHDNAIFADLAPDRIYTGGRSRCAPYVLCTRPWTHASPHRLLPPPPGTGGADARRATPMSAASFTAGLLAPSGLGGGLARLLRRRLPPGRR